MENLGKTQFLSRLDVADIGCGGGLLSESLARLGARTTGVDASASNIGIATTHAARDPLLSREHTLGGPSLTYLHTTAEDLVAQNRTFDVVCAMEVLEHVNGPADFLRSLNHLVRPGGHLFLSTIARTPLSWFLTIFMAEDVLRLVTPGTHTHEQYINPKEIVDFFKDDLKWYGQGKTDLPQRLHFETRGTAYLPWKVLGHWRKVGQVYRVHRSVIISSGRGNLSMPRIPQMQYQSQEQTGTKNLSNASFCSVMGIDCCHDRYILQ